MELTKQDVETQIKLLFNEWVRLKDQNTMTKVRYAGPKFGREEYGSMLDAIFSDWWSGGSFTNKAEKMLSEISEKSFGLLTNSGSSANLVMMSAAKDLYFKDGDKILTLACGFPTTVNPIIQNNLIPKFVDIDLETLNLSPYVLEENLKNDSEIKGVFVAHTLGFKSDIDAILDISRKYNVHVFFDCCDAYGTKYKGVPIQHYGKASTFSFYVAHHISCGEGGGIVTNDHDLQIAMRSYRNWGRYCASPNCCIRSIHPSSFCPMVKQTQNSELPKDYIVNYQYEVMGYNLKPLELQAAILIEQIKKIGAFDKERKLNYKSLMNRFKVHNKYFKLWEIDEDVSPFGFPVLISPSAPFKRNHLVDFMTQNNIETRMLFGGNLTKHPAYTNRNSEWEASENLENSDIILKDFVLFGVAPILNEDHMNYIGDKLDLFIERWEHA